MLPIPTHVARSVVCLCVCVLGTLASPAKMDEPIEMLLGRGQTRIEPCAVFDRDAHWRHLNNTIKRFLRRGGAALCQITLFTRNYTGRQKKRTTFPLWINLLTRNVIWQNIVILLLMNVIVDVTYLISGISTNFHRLLCKKCDIGY